MLIAKTVIQVVRTVADVYGLPAQGLRGFCEKSIGAEARGMVILVAWYWCGHTIESAARAVNRSQTAGSNLLDSILKRLRAEPGLRARRDQVLEKLRQS